MQYIQYETKDKVGYIALNRPDKRNALNQQVVTELKQAFSLAEKDADVKVIVLKANGQSFCAGADLGYMQTLQKNTFEENYADSSQLKELFYQIYTHSKVVIAQVQGHAIAGGCGLATVCDFSFTVPDAKFGYTEVRIGFIPAIVKVFLLRKIGEGKSKELLLTGDLITAEEAKNMGLINWIVLADELEMKVNEFAQKLIKNNSAQSMALTKKMIAEVPEKSLSEALDYAAKMNAQARATPDCQKGIAAFLNKEEIKW